MVEIYFWTCGMLHEEEYSLARMFFAKTFGMVSLMDDTFDVHATLEECHKLKEAMQRLATMIQILFNYQLNLALTLSSS